MTNPALRETEWRLAPGKRVRLRMPLDRPRALDGKTGTVRFYWPGATDGFPWLVSLDRPAIDGRRAYTLVLCAPFELEPADDDRGDERRRVLGGYLSFPRPFSRVDLRAGPIVDRLSPAVPLVGDQSHRQWTGSSASWNAAPRAQSGPEIISYRWQSEFVGRARETAMFAESLSLPFDDDRRRFFFNVVGPSGVGKTWLLRRFEQIFRRSGGLVLWADDSDEDVVGMIDRIAGQLAVHGWTHRQLEDALRRHRESIRESYAAGRPVSDSVSDRCARNAGSGSGTPAYPNVPSATASQVAGTATLELLLAEMDPQIARAADPQPLRAAIREITPLFVDALRATASERKIALFFDGYERFGPDLDGWLRSILDGEHGDLPGSTIVVVAGRSPVDATRWGGFEEVITRVPLGPWTEDEARSYLLHHWILDERVVRTIEQVSGRLPVLVATMAVRANDQLDRLTRTDRNALDCFLTSLGDPARRAVAVDASVPRRLDVDVLAQVIDASERGSLVDWLRKMPFVEQRGGAWTYRPVVREVLLRHLRAESPGRWLELQARLASYYERLADALNLDGPSRLRDATAQAYEMEALYHRLCQNPPSFLASALNGFVGRFGGETTFVRRWAEMISQAGRDAADGTTERWGDRLVESVDAFASGRLEVTAKAFGALVASDQLDLRAHRAALAWRARLLVGAGKFELAVEAYDRLVETEPNRAAYWAERATPLVRLGRHRDARCSLDRAIALDPNNRDFVRHRNEIDRLSDILHSNAESASEIVAV